MEYFIYNIERKVAYWKNEIVTKKRYTSDLIKRIDILDSILIMSPMRWDIKILQENESNIGQTKPMMKEKLYGQFISGLIILPNATCPDLSFTT